MNNLHDRLPQLVDPSDIDCQRWPWELVHNAKDTVVKRPNPEDRFVDIIIEPKEWEWIDVNNEDNALHYIVRVFDVENYPKAYFLKQELMFIILPIFWTTAKKTVSLQQPKIKKDELQKETES